MSVLAIIPARGGSKGIPRKNLRPVAGKPMIYYSITACLKSKVVDAVIVSTDDEEIAVLSEKFGATVQIRSKELADDKTALDPVIENVVINYEEKNNINCTYIVTVQPTSPLVTAEDIDQVVNKLIDSGVNTVQTVVEDRHLCWTIENQKAKPLYKNRVNRQLLPANYKETGAVIACTREQLHQGTRIGEYVELIETPQNRSFDIDTFADLYLCEALIKRKKIIITVVGYSSVGLGHAYRTVMLANELVNYEILFICEIESGLAINYIKDHNYDVLTCPQGSLVDEVLYHKPDLVINDILNTSKDYVERLKANQIKVVNFEDMGSGAQIADIVVNALYPHQSPSNNILVGEKYFCVRDEFLFTKPKNIVKDKVQEILLTFGGVDEGNLSLRVYNLIRDYCSVNEIKITIVVGPGYPHLKELKASCKVAGYYNVKLISNTKRISDLMNRADLAITSGGRTVLELASLYVPTIVICQNEREVTHTFASTKNGIHNLGYRNTVSDDTIFNTFSSFVESSELRTKSQKKMKKIDLKNGKKRVIKIISNLLN